MDAVAVPPPPGLYLHVPFCLSKCAYCAFFSRCTDDETVAAWVRGVEQELHRLPSAFHPQTIYVGGGTPSLLPEKTWEQVLSLLHHHVDTSNVREWTVEMNPGTLTAEKAAFFKTVGVTRASLGIQSWNDDILAWLGRVHTAAQAKTAVELLHHAGFDNISMDLIYGLPDVPEERVMQDVDTTLSFEPQHISCYCLEV